MYHIAEDPRARRSAGLICQGLLDCLGEKEFSQLTVTDLWKASGVSRATFYRLFDNVTDVLTYQCETVMDSILDAFRAQPSENLSYREMSLTILRTSMDHAVLLEAVSRAGRLDIIQRALLKHGDLLRGLYFTGQPNPGGDGEYFLSCVCLLISSLIELWLKNGRRQTAEELYDTFQDTLKMLAWSFCG